MKNRIKSRRFALTVFAFLLLAYVASYAVLSRRGFADAQRQDFDGFYFFPPEDTDRSRRTNFGCAYFYYPLIVIDNAIGTGRPISCEPLWNLN